MLAILIFIGAYFRITSHTSQPKTVAIGVVNPTLTLDPVLDGFKAGMAKLGYIEGNNITYIYQGPTGSIKSLGPAIEKLIEAKVDLIFSATIPGLWERKQPSSP